MVGCKQLRIVLLTLFVYQVSQYMESNTSTLKREFVSPLVKILPINMSKVLMMSNEQTHEEDLF